MELLDSTSEVCMARLVCIMVLLVFNWPVQASEEAPSWVIGIRNGSEGSKLNMGSKIFYRRLIGDVNGDKNLTCQKAIEAAEESLRAEIHFDVKIPYSLEVIYYDNKEKDCAVTISISSKLMNKLLEINEFKKNEKVQREEIEIKLKKSKQEKAGIEKKYNELKQVVKDNYELFEKYNRMMSDYDRAKSIAINRKEKAKMFAITGLRQKEFQSKIGERVEINFDQDSICNRNQNRVYSSNHAGVNVCWTDKYGLPEIVSFCHDGQCFTQ